MCNDCREYRRRSSKKGDNPYRDDEPDFWESVRKFSKLCTIQFDTRKDKSEEEDVEVPDKYSFRRNLNVTGSGDRDRKCFAISNDEMKREESRRRRRRNHQKCHRHVTGPQRRHRGGRSAQSLGQYHGNESHLGNDQYSDEESVEDSMDDYDEGELLMDDLLSEENPNHDSNPDRGSTHLYGENDPPPRSNQNYDSKLGNGVMSSKDENEQPTNESPIDASQNHDGKSGGYSAGRYDKVVPMNELGSEENRKRLRRRQRRCHRHANGPYRRYNSGRSLHPLGSYEKNEFHKENSDNIDFRAEGEDVDDYDEKYDKEEIMDEDDGDQYEPKDDDNFEDSDDENEEQLYDPPSEDNLGDDLEPGNDSMAPPGNDKFRSPLPDNREKLAGGTGSDDMGSNDDDEQPINDDDNQDDDFDPENDSMAPSGKEEFSPPLPDKKSKTFSRGEPAYPPKRGRVPKNKSSSLQVLERKNEKDEEDDAIPGIFSWENWKLQWNKVRALMGRCYPALPCSDGDDYFLPICSKPENLCEDEQDDSSDSDSLSDNAKSGDPSSYSPDEPKRSRRAGRTLLIPSARPHHPEKGRPPGKRVRPPGEKIRPADEKIRPADEKRDEKTRIDSTDEKLRSQDDQLLPSDEELRPPDEKLRLPDEELRSPDDKVQPQDGKLRSPDENQFPETVICYEPEFWTKFFEIVILAPLLAFTAYLFVTWLIHIRRYNKKSAQLKKSKRQNEALRAEADRLEAYLMSAQMSPLTNGKRQAEAREEAARIWEQLNDHKQKMRELEEEKAVLLEVLHNLRKAEEDQGVHSCTSPIITQPHIDNTSIFN